MNNKAKKSIKKKKKRKTLGIFLKFLINETVTVELRNDTILKGVLKDAKMDMTLVMEIDKTPVYIHGKQLKYIHIPDHINMLEKLQ